MKTTTLFPAIILATAAALIPLRLKASDDSGGAGGDVTRGGDGGAGGDGVAFRPPEISNEALAAFEKTLTTEERGLLEAITLEYCVAVLKQQENRPLQGQKAPTLDDLTKAYYLHNLKFLAPLTQEQLKKYFESLPNEIKMARTRNNPAYVDESDRKAAEALPAEARADADDLLSSDLNAYFVARRKLLARGNACIPLVAQKLASLKDGDERGLRLRSLLAELRQDSERQKERIIRTAEAAERRVEALNAARPAGAKSRYAWLLSRRLVSSVQLPVYEHTCYYSFPKARIGYEGNVSLMYDNSPSADGLSVMMYGGQENRIADLGGIDLAAATATANAKALTWSKRDLPGVKGHVYLEHCLEPQDGINLKVAFRIVELVSGEYIVLEWMEVPQDK